MTNELKPCPFCGGEAIIRTYRTFIDEYHGIGTKYYVACSECLADRHLGKLTENEAIEAWNTRAERTCKWTQWEQHSDQYFSTECGREFQWATPYDLPNYCPGCGAKLVLE